MKTDIIPLTGICTEYLKEGDAILDLTPANRRRRNGRIAEVSLVRITDAPKPGPASDANENCFPGAEELILTAEKAEEEAAMLDTLRGELRHIRRLVTFNGRAFDLPVLQGRCEAHGIPNPAAGIPARDLFAEYRPLASILALPGRKLADYDEAICLAHKALQGSAHSGGDTDMAAGSRLLGQAHTDNPGVPCPGYDAHAFCSDAARTLRILGFDAILSLLDGHHRLLDASMLPCGFAGESPAPEGSGCASAPEEPCGTPAQGESGSAPLPEKSGSAPVPERPGSAPVSERPGGTCPSAAPASGELLYTLELSVPFPGKLSIRDGIYTLHIEGGRARILIPFTDGKVRVYHTDVKNYVWLPVEGYAVHKSVGRFVDSRYKEKAVRENCFHLVSYSEDFLNSPEWIQSFLSSVLQYLSCP